MPVTDSRVYLGSLTLGTTPGVEYTGQFTNVRIDSTYSDVGSAVTTFDGTVLPPSRRRDSQTLAGTFVQDFDSETGLSNYLYDNDLEEVPFTWVPNDVSAPTLAGVCRLESGSYGGNVQERNTSDIAWVCIGEVTRTPGVVANGTGRKGKEAAAA